LRGSFDEIRQQFIIPYFMPESLSLFFPFLIYESCSFRSALVFIIATIADDYAFFKLMKLRNSPMIPRVIAAICAVMASLRSGPPLFTISGTVDRSHRRL
jgi:hypothetical protein